MKDLKYVARKAKSNPRAAKKALDELAMQLDDESPKQLPAFWEEAGRIYLRANNRTYGAKCLEEAHAVQKEYGFRIDEDHRREVFLEFSHLGLPEHVAHSKESALCASNAYTQFRRVTVEGIKSGLPPYESMASDLRALANSAGLDAFKEEQEIIEEIIQEPALAEAPEAFWTGYSPAIIAGAADPTFQSALLAVFPKRIDSATWISIMRDAGVIDRITSQPNELARWLGKAIDQHHPDDRGYPDANPVLENLLLELGPQLTTASTTRPVIRLSTLFDYDLDILDLLAELDIGVLSSPRTRSPICLFHHLHRRNNSRSLEHLASSDHWKSLLREELTDYLSTEAVLAPPLRDRVTPAHILAPMGEFSGIIRALREMVSDSIAAASSSLFNYGLALAYAEHLSSDAGLKIVGDLVTELPEPKIADLIAQAFNAGILDELGWPSLESVIEEFSDNSDEDAYFDVSDSWPHAIVHNDERAVVVSRSGVILDHTIQIPEECPLSPNGSLSFISVGPSELLVYWSPKNVEGSRAYWTSKPDDVFEIADDWLYILRDSLPTRGGGRTFAHREFHAGHRGFPKKRDAYVYGDGERFWIAKELNSLYDDELPSSKLWTELDVVTGKRGNASFPRFLLDIASNDDRRVISNASMLRPLNSDYAHNPLGWHNGTVGTCWSVDSAGQWQIQRSDGVKSSAFNGLHFDDSFIGNSTQLLSLPGDALLLVTGHKNANAHTGEVTGDLASKARFYYATGIHQEISAEQRHNFSVRHEETSLKLRHIKGEELRELISVATTPANTWGDEPPAIFTLLEIGAFEALFPGAPHTLMPGIMSIIQGGKTEIEIAEILRRKARSFQAGPDQSPRSLASRAPLG